MPMRILVCCSCKAIILLYDCCLSDWMNMIPTVSNPQCHIGSQFVLSLQLVNNGRTHNNLSGVLHHQCGICSVPLSYIYMEDRNGGWSLAFILIISWKRKKKRNLCVEQVVVCCFLINCVISFCASGFWHCQNFIEGKIGSQWLLN